MTTRETRQRLVDQPHLFANHLDPVAWQPAIDLRYDSVPIPEQVERHDRRYDSQRQQGQQRTQAANEMVGKSGRIGQRRLRRGGEDALQLPHLLIRQAAFNQPHEEGNFFAQRRKIHRHALGEVN